MIQVGLALRVATPQRPPSATYKKKKTAILSLVGPPRPSPISIAHRAAGQRATSRAASHRGGAGPGEEMRGSGRGVLPGGNGVPRRRRDREGEQAKALLRHRWIQARRIHAHRGGLSMRYARRCAVDRSAREGNWPGGDRVAQSSRGQWREARGRGRRDAPHELGETCGGYCLRSERGGPGASRAAHRECSLSLGKKLNPF